MKSLNEVARMQQLAGIKNKSLLKENKVNQQLKDLVDTFGDSTWNNYDTIKFSEDEEVWNLGFSMKVPKENFGWVDTVEEAEEFFSDEYDQDDYRGPGGSFHKSRVVSVNDIDDFWIVNISARGGLDI